MSVGSDGTIAVGSELFYTGLLLDPAGKQVTHTPFCQSGLMLTRDQIAKIVTDPERKTARQIFDPSWIKNQGAHNSCCPYAIGAIMEKTAYLKDSRRIKLGPESLYAQVNGGRDRGAVLRDGINAAQSYGMAPESMVQHGVFRKADIGLEADRNAKRFRLIKGESFSVQTDAELASAVASGFCVLVAVEVSNAWYSLDSRGVVNPTTGSGNHAIHVDDIRINDKGEFEYDHAGSWKTSYGESGRGWITWARHMRDSVHYHDFIAVRAISDDPDTQHLPAKS